MEEHARLHSGRELCSRLWDCRVTPSATASTLLSLEKTILRAACEGQLAHVSIHIMRQEERGRGGRIMQDEAWHSVNVQSARRLGQTHPKQARLVSYLRRNRKTFRRQRVPCRGGAP